MTKKHFIALADAMRRAEPRWQANGNDVPLRMQWERDIEHVANFCQGQNPNFNYDRWMGYIKGSCGPNGGAIKPPRAVSLAQQEHEESGCTDYLQHRAQDCPYLH